MTDEKNPYLNAFLSGENPRLLKPELLIGILTFLFSLYLLVSVIIKTIYFHYAEGHSHIVFEYTLFFLLFFVSFLIAFYTLPKMHKNLFMFHSWMIDIRRFLLSIVVFADVIILLIILKYMVNPTTLPKIWDANLEWTIALGTIIGIVGTLWALYAKMDAGRAFLQAKDAHEEASKATKAAMDAFRAIAGIVSFEDMLVPQGERQGVPMLKGLLEAAHEELIMVLGVPSVGYFRRIIDIDSSGNERKSYPLRDISIDFCYELAEFIRKIPQKNDLKLVRLFYLDDASLDSFIDGAVEKGEMSDNDKKILKASYENLENAIKNLPDNVKEIFHCERYNVELGLRFVIARSTLNYRMTEDMALVWVVSDFEHDDPGSFESAGFTTRDINIIQNLRRLSKDYVRILPKLEMKVTS